MSGGQVPEPPSGFGRLFDQAFDLDAEPGNKAFFGTNVLDGLVAGIDDFIYRPQPRWRHGRVIGPALLGSAMWIDDEELLAKLRELSGVSVVITKQTRKPRKVDDLEALEQASKGIRGFPADALSELRQLAPKVDGGPRVVGPTERVEPVIVPAIRTLGFRKRGKHLAPIVHAKLAVLGKLWWHDEGPLGHPEDITGFTPQRLWVSSANFTTSSRRSLEFGYWVEDRQLVQGATRFLTSLVASSESLDPESDTFDPEFLPWEYDAEELNDYAIEMLRDAEPWDEELDE
jgi:hypothetical protein